MELGRLFWDKKYTWLKFPLHGLELSSKPDDYRQAKMFPFDKFRKVVVYIVLFWSTEMEWINELLKNQKSFKFVQGNITKTCNLFVQHYCKASWKRMLRVLPPSFKPLKRAVSRQSSSFCLILPIIYSPSIAMELKVNKEITCKWQNQRSETNKYISWALFLKLQAAGINFEKLLGWTVFKNPNSIRFNLLQFSPSVASVVCVMLF